MNTAYFLIGVPGSGKSTWADQKIRDFPDIAHISTDKYIEDLAKKQGVTYSDMFSHVYGDACDAMSAALQAAFDNEHDIIWDQTNMSAKSRKSKISKLKAAGYKIVAVVFKVDRSELDRRLEHRRLTTGKNIHPHVVDSMLETYVEPTLDEGFCGIIFV